MKMNAKMIGYMLVCILALYGIIILIRKMMMNEPKKGWFEPYKKTKCVETNNCWCPYSGGYECSCCDRK
jgi:hypothetical protein